MLTGLELMFMSVTRSNSGLFSTPGFGVSPVGKRGRVEKREGGRERKEKKKQRWEGGKKEIEKEERKEGGMKE